MPERCPRTCCLLIVGIFAVVLTGCGRSMQAQRGSFPASDGGEPFDIKTSWKETIGFIFTATEHYRLLIDEDQPERFELRKGISLMSQYRQDSFGWGKRDGVSGTVKLVDDGKKVLLQIVNQEGEAFEHNGRWWLDFW